MRRSAEASAGGPDALAAGFEVGGELRSDKGTQLGTRTTRKLGAFLIGAVFGAFQTEHPW